MSLSKTLLSLSISAALTMPSTMLFAQGKNIAQPKTKAKTMTINKTIYNSASFSNYSFDKAMPEDSFEDEDFDESLEDFYGDEDFVSIATGNKKPLHKAPAVTTVITRRDIANLGATHLDEVLERVPGLHVGTSSISRIDSIYAIRGIQTGFTPQVLVLLNGIEFKNLFTSGLPFTFRYPLTNVDKIEIIRGPGSALYGADAFSGVINIITNQSEKEQTLVGGRLGSFSSYDFWLHTQHQFEGGSWRVSAERQHSEGDNGRIAEADLQTTFDSVFGSNASLAPAALATRYDILNVHADIKWNNWQWENWYWQQVDGGLGPGGAQVLDPAGTQDVDQFRSTIRYENNISDNLSVNAYASWMNANSDSYFVLFPSNTVLPIGGDGNINFTDVNGIVKFTEGYIGNPTSAQESFHTSFSLSWQGWLGHKVTSAIGFNDYEVKTKEYKNFGPGVIDGSQAVVDGTLTDVTDTPYIFTPNTERENYYLLMQDEWLLSNDIELTLGIRYDDYSDFGSSVNPRAALVWQTSQKLTTKILYGSAFRAPSVNELFLKNNPAAIGNPNAQPEEIDTWEVAFEYKPSFDMRLAVNLYQYKAVGLIDKEPTDLGLQIANNIDQDGYGFETEIDWQVDESVKLYANYSWQHSENTQSKVDIVETPGQLFYFDIAYQASDVVYLSSQLWWVGDRKRASNDNRPSIDDYTLVNIKASWQLTTEIKLSSIVKNVFDESAAEPSNGSIKNDYLREGRSIWLEAQYQF